MKYEIKEQLIPGLPHNSYRYGRPEIIVLHETGAWGGTAESNRDYEADHWHSAFVHFFVDWNSIVQVALTDYLAWGAGWYANQRAIHIELVRTRDYNQFIESYKRYVWLVARMLHQYGLKPTRRGGLWTHHDVTNILGGTTHTDPDSYLAYHGYTVDQLINDIKDAYYEEYEISSAPTMRLGDNGYFVKQLQENLIELGYDLSPYGADGDFGGVTEDAVIAFQEDYGLTVDGIAGPATNSKLDEVIELLKDKVEKLEKELNDLKEAVQYKAPNDAEPADWAKEAVEWVKERGLTEGYRPKDDVTREELWVTLYRQEAE